MTAHLAPTPTLARALRAWTAQVANARADYEAEPIRSCRWLVFDKPCHRLRTDDPTYCTKHRGEAKQQYAKKAAKRMRDNARRRAARAAA